MPLDTHGSIVRSPAGFVPDSSPEPAASEAGDAPGEVVDAAAAARGESPARAQACHQDGRSAAAQGFEDELLELPRLLARLSFQVSPREMEAQAAVDLVMRTAPPYFDREAALLSVALQRGEVDVTRKWAQEILGRLDGDNPNVAAVRDSLITAGQAGLAGGPRSAEQVDAFAALFETVLQGGWTSELPEQDKHQFIRSVGGFDGGSSHRVVNRDLTGGPFAIAKLGVAISRSAPDDATRQARLDQLGEFANSENPSDGPSHHPGLKRLLESPDFDLSFKKTVLAEVGPFSANPRMHINRMPRHAGAVIVTIQHAAIPDATKAKILRALPYSPEDVLARLLRDADMSRLRLPAERWTRAMLNARRLMVENPA